jgi:hypothetical protein
LVQQLIRCPETLCYHSGCYKEQRVNETTFHTHSMFGRTDSKDSLLIHHAISQVLCDSSVAPSRTIRCFQRLATCILDKRKVSYRSASVVPLQHRRNCNKGRSQNVLSLLTCTSTIEMLHSKSNVLDRTSLRDTVGGYFIGFPPHFEHCMR